MLEHFTLEIPEGQEPTEEEEEIRQVSYLCAKLRQTELECNLVLHRPALIFGVCRGKRACLKLPKASFREVWVASLPTLHYTS